MIPMAAYRGAVRKALTPKKHFRFDAGDRRSQMSKAILVLVILAAMGTVPMAEEGYAPVGAVTTPGYIPDTKVAAAVAAGGGTLLQDPGITIAVERISASPTAKMD